MHSVLSLCRQSIAPDKIILSISKEKYLEDDGFSQPPSWVESFPELSDILDIRWVENTGPYRKLLPIILEVDENDLVITVDDDVIYHKEWLKAIAEASKEYPNHVISSRVRRKRRNVFGKYTSYILWPVVREKMEFHDDFVIIGCGGVAYRRSFFNAELLSMGDFLNCAPTTDDLWFSKLLEMSRTPVLSLPSAISLTSDIIHKYNLSAINALQGGGFYRKAFIRLKAMTLGWLGFLICTNDLSHKDIENKFKDYKLSNS
ncbi:glycosyltransferase [Litchfieldella rifensis]|uniref:Glycosyltransferase n=1 Tax=Litchfieldella rifensis TaxID=762643 RepID=A0ABV7LTU0_9GAMM